MAGFLPGAPKTPVKILRSSLHDLCRVCNVNLRTSGQGKFNLFEGEATKKHPDYPPFWDFPLRKSTMHPRGCVLNAEERWRNLKR